MTKPSTTQSRVGVDAMFLVANIVIAVFTPHDWLRIVALVLCGWYVRLLAERLP